VKKPSERTVFYYYTIFNLFGNGDEFRSTQVFFEFFNENKEKSAIFADFSF